MEEINLEMRARKGRGKKDDGELMRHLELTARPDFSEDTLRVGEDGGEYEKLRGKTQSQARRHTLGRSPDPCTGTRREDYHAART